MFEYKLILVDPEWSADAGRENLEKQLNDLGKNGWELLPVTLGGYLFLKRFKPNAKA